MSNTKYKVSLPVEQLAGGGFSEKIQAEFEKVMENIHDPNVKATGKRTVTAKFTFEPDEEREMIKLSMDFKTGLVAPEGISTKLVTGKDLRTNTIEAQEFLSNQRGQTFIDTDGSLKSDVGEPIDVIERETQKQDKILKMRGNE